MQHDLLSSTMLIMTYTFSKLNGKICPFSLDYKLASTVVPHAATSQIVRTVPKAANCPRNLPRIHALFGWRDGGNSRAL